MKSGSQQVSFKMADCTFIMPQSHPKLVTAWMTRQNLLQDGSLLNPAYQAWVPPSHQCNSGIDICPSVNFPRSPSNTLVHSRVRESSGTTDPNQGSESKFGKPTETSRGSMSKCHSCLWKSPQLLGLFNSCSLLRHYQRRQVWCVTFTL